MLSASSPLQGQVTGFMDSVGTAGADGQVGSPTSLAVIDRLEPSVPGGSTQPRQGRASHRLEYTCSLDTRT